MPLVIYRRHVGTARVDLGEYRYLRRIRRYVPWVGQRRPPAETPMIRHPFGRHQRPSLPFAHPFEYTQLKHKEFNQPP
jgi:hypothetical protein